MAPITPNADWLRAEVRRFVANSEELTSLLDDSTHSAWPVSFYNCRPKSSGSGAWSDHAWGNALDIMWLYKGTTPVAARPGEPHYLDPIWEWLEANLEAFDLRTSQMLWRVPKHWNHIHVSFRHRAVGDPPCDGGRLETINPAGGWVRTAGLGATPPPAGGEPLDVSQLQVTLKASGYDPGPVDGIWGPRTMSAWQQSMGWSGG